MTQEEKDFIEIPFGAADSELCGWEYTIPEGYTAEIKDGKIIVKKEESEDEKIRKEIIALVKSQKEQQWHRDGAIYDRMIAWLEKQKSVEWSEEDEHRSTDAIYFLDTAKKHYADTSELEATISWLESLKNRLK